MNEIKQVQQESTILNNINILASSSEKIRELVMDLEERLTLVVADGAETKNEVAKINEVCHSPLAKELRKIDDSLLFSIDRLNNILTLLDL